MSGSHSVYFIYFIHMFESPFSLTNVSFKFFKVYFSWIFKVPAEAYCNLPEAITKIGKEVEVTIEQCNGSGCFEFPISYDVNMDQIRALISRSTKCTQLVEFSCFSSPIKVIMQRCLFQEILWCLMETQFFQSCYFHQSFKKKFSKLLIITTHENHNVF